MFLDLNQPQEQTMGMRKTKPPVEKAGKAGKKKPLERHARLERREGLDKSGRLRTMVDHYSRSGTKVAVTVDRKASR